jgi:hypothetical protein
MAIHLKQYNPSMSISSALTAEVSFPPMAGSKLRYLDLCRRLGVVRSL